MESKRLALVSVGNALMDEQHRQLVEILERLLVLVNNTDDIGSIEHGQVELYGRAIKHFTDEELLMEIIAFPWLDDHKTAHHQFAGRLASLMARFQRGDLDFARQSLEGLHSWLLVHIKHDDKRYAAGLHCTEPVQPLSINHTDYAMP